MKKYFCNVCDKEIKNYLQDNSMKMTAVFNDGPHSSIDIDVQVGIDIDTDEFNICEHCLLDEVYKMETRPEYKKAIYELKYKPEEPDQI